MPISDVISEKKKALLAYKQDILQELQYYDKRIEDARLQGMKNSFYYNDDSSDSDDEPLIKLDCSPSRFELKHEQAMLRTCLQATQELTSLQVLQSEVNILVEDPQFEGEPPVTEPGVWREVTAECRVDLVPFSISFFVHQPERRLAARSYRGLRAQGVRPAHAAELARGVLPALRTPSDAVQVLKSYAQAHRSRRSSLARLAEKFAGTLYMEPMEEGGYLLKCAELLEVSWSLQNKWSPVAPFHHRMKFELEYMDESYIKIITQLHRQLSDPSIETDERTQLLAKIIATCLEAQGPTQELYDSMSSDPEGARRLKQRRTTLDREPPAPPQSRPDIMAPPAIPPRRKPKGKENMADNRKEKLKRLNTDEEINKNKKRKTEPEPNQNVEANDVTDDEDEIIDTRPSKNTNTKEANPKSKHSVVSDKNSKINKVNKNNADTESQNKNVASGKDADEQISAKKNKKDAIGKGKSDVTSSKNEAQAVNSNKKVDKAKIVKQKSDLDKNQVANAKNTNKAVESTSAIKAKVTKEKSYGDMNVKNTAKNVETNKAKEVKEKKKNNVLDKGTNKITKPKDVKNSEKEQDNDAASKVNKDKKIADKDKTAKNTIKDDDIEKDTENTGTVTKKAIDTNKKPKDKNPASKTKEINKDKPDSNKNSEKTKSVANVKSKDPTKTKNVTDNTNNKVKENATNKVTSKNELASVKTATDNTKKIVSNKTKTINEGSEASANKVKTKSVANVKNKVATKENVQKTTKNNKLITDSNIESTLEKVVERRSMTKSKSNLADRIVDENNVAINKIPKTTEADKVLSSNKSVAMKRKSNYIDKDPNSIAVVKKRALNENFEKKINSDKAKKLENFQKSTKIDGKFKSKLMPGSMKAVIPGNTKFSSAGNIGSTKIPQKKMAPISEATLNKNPLRISPRKIASKFKTTVDGAKFLQKTTSIPRLMKKPVAKT